MKMPSCPVCQRDLDSLGAGNLVKPFWTQIGRFFLFPANLGPLIVMMSLLVIGFLLAQTNALIFLLGLVVLVFVFIKYCLVVLEDTAHGHTEPRPVSIDGLTSEMELPFKLFLLHMAVYGILNTAYDMFGQVGFVPVNLFFTVAFPAMIMVLAMEHSFFKALNPLFVSSVMARIGFPYLILIGLLFSLEGAAFTVFRLLGGVLPTPIMGLVFAFSVMYFVMVMYTMMGYVLYQYHEKLGFQVEVEAHEQSMPAAAAATTPGDPAVREAEILIQEGKTEEAARRLEQIARDNPTDYDARERLLKLLRLNQDNKSHQRQGQEFISYLVAHNQLSKAAGVFRECYQFDPGFKPAKAHERLAIARVLKENGEGKLAVAVTNNLHRDFPGFDGIPEAYLLVAQLLCEKFNQDDKAKQILNFIVSNYPNHPKTDEAKQYFEVIKQLSA